MRTDRRALGDFEARLRRATATAASPGVAQPLAFLIAVLEHQRERAIDGEVAAVASRVASGVAPRRLLGEFPLLNLDAAVDAVADEIGRATDARAHPMAAAPEPLRAAGHALAGLSPSERSELATTWFDEPALVEPRWEAWIRIAAGPILERAAARVEPPDRDEWAGRACPLCGDLPQASVIVEESGGFLQGAPRYLVCRRCAAWWAFPRATCPSCGEDDSRRIAPYVDDDRRWVRLDVCDTCRSYIKTFDLREPGGVDVVPLVDDVATLPLDLWAHDEGLVRASRSLAGV